MFQNKCAVYWPSDKSQPRRFGKFTVSLMEEQSMAEFTIRTLRYSYLEVSDSSVYHNTITSCDVAHVTHITSYSS